MKKLDKAAATIAGAVGHYNRLGVQSNASMAEIKTAHRALALLWHPDRCQHPQAPTTMALVNEAYTTLSDPVLRRKYDLINGHNRKCELCGGTGKVRRMQGFKPVMRSCECMTKK